MGLVEFVLFLRKESKLHIEEFFFINFIETEQCLSDAIKLTIDEIKE